MAATGKTPNYNIPIYNAGDTVNDLVSYNTAMGIIDTEMKNNSVATGVAEDDIAGLTATVDKHTEDITALNTAVTQAQGSAQGALNQIQEIVNSTTITFNTSDKVDVYCFKNDSVISLNINASSNLTLPTLTTGSKTRYILGKIDNKNPFNAMPSETVVRGTVLVVNAATKEINTLTIITIYYDGTNTFLLSDASLANINNAIYIVFTHGVFLYNSQPGKLG